MATQGVVSVVISGKTAVKAVAGSDGYNARLLAAEICRDHLVTPEAILLAAKKVGFGHKDDLVIQASDRNLFEGDSDLAGLYLDSSKFADAHFNPRWEQGSADHIEIVNFRD